MPERQHSNLHTDKKKSKVTSVFYWSLAVVLAVVGTSLFFPTEFAAAASDLTAAITRYFGWYYLALVMMIVFFCVFLIVSPAAKIHLGNPGGRPEFNNLSWLAMLFSAGMGIGLVFWGAAEPLSHFAVSTPNAPVGSQEALQDALQYSFFHWGFSAWALYGLVALALAYFKFRKKEKSLISVTLKPLLGRMTDGWVGKVVDIIAVFATILGVATSLGLGAAQINGGLNYLFGVPNDISVQLIIVVVTTALFIMSALSGLTRGLRILSNVNVILAVGLLACCLIVGPTTDIMNGIVSGFGSYVQNFLVLSTGVTPFDQDANAWIDSWTIFYWAWWIAWSPFVGVFIARISKGRTIREFLLGVILIPTLFSAVWFGTFGGMSMGAELGGAGLASLATETTLFATLAQYPLGPILSIVALVLIFSFFITSADSATFVLGMMSEDGALEPRKSVKAVWGILLSAIAIILMMAGGLSALQNVLIISAFPFSIIILLMTFSLSRELRHESREMGLYLKPETYPKPGEPFKSYIDADHRDLSVRAQRLRIIKDRFSGLREVPAITPYSEDVYHVHGDGEDTEDTDTRPSVTISGEADLHTVELDSPDEAEDGAPRR